MAARLLTALPMPTGRELLRTLPQLAAALDGSGPAVAPVAAGGPLPDLGIGEVLGPGEDDPADPTAVVIATSGSTGTPKGSLLSRAALAASAAATAERLGTGRWLLALPAHHIAGLQVLLRSLATGEEPHLLDTGLPFTPERFLDAVGAMPPGPRLVSLVPTQLHRLLHGPAEALAALTEFDAVLVGGAATPAATLTAARDAGVRVVTSYGMSETCGGCVYDGIPLAAVSVALDEGRIELTGPMVARGYRGMPGHPSFPRPSTFRTDDLGEWNGRLTVLGRADDVIVTGGLKVLPGAVEQVLAAVPGVGEVVVTGVPDPEWGQCVVAVLTAVPRGPAPTLEALRAAATAELSAAAAPRRFVIVDAIPTRGPGKPDRKAAARLAAEATS